MVYLLALGSAAFYGAADFLGGLATRRLGSLSVVVLSQAAGVIPLAIAILLLPPVSLSRIDLLWSVCAGLAGGVGVALLYRALAIGTMAVVAPMTAVAACCIPLCLSLWLGERLAWLAIIGIALAIISIVLVSRQRTMKVVGGSNTESGFRLPIGGARALAAGIAIGFFFLALAQTGSNAGLWPLFIARLVSIAFFGTLAIVRGQPLWVPPRMAAVPLLGGLFDIFATALYLLAVRRGLLSIVAPLSSLYPAATVLLARVVLRERLSPWQVTGLGCGLAAIVLTLGPWR